MAGAMNVVIENYSSLMKEIKDMKKQSEKAMRRTVSDFKSRGPGWVSQEVTKEYNIKKKDVNETKQGVRKGRSQIKVAGTKVDNLQIVYRGRLLTPTHFKMKPTAPVPWYEAYRNYDAVNTVTAKVFKKSPRKPLGHKVFLARSGGSGSMYIPFQRRGSRRTPIDVIKTVSVPQMITNEKVAKQIHERIKKELPKRLEHNIKHVMKK